LSVLAPDLAPDCAVVKSGSLFPVRGIYFGSSITNVQVMLDVEDITSTCAMTIDDEELVCVCSNFGDTPLSLLLYVEVNGQPSGDMYPIIYICFFCGESKFV
jgi:hypothetical protein